MLWFLAKGVGMGGGTAGPVTPVSCCYRPSRTAESASGYLTSRLAASTVAYPARVSTSPLSPPGRPSKCC